MARALPPRSMNSMLTPRQKRVLDFIRQFIRQRGMVPSLAEIGAGLKLNSMATVHKHLRTLEIKGYIRRPPGQYRAMELLPLRRPPAEAEPGSLPLAGRIAAGQPLEAIPRQEAISLAAITRGRECYVLEVRGDSMVDAHILDGDFVVIEPVTRVRDGDMVVALIDTEEATLKTWYREPDGMIRLQPANPRLQPIRLEPGRVQVQGRVLGVLRRCGR